MIFATSHAITSVSISPDAKYVVAGSLDNCIRVWDIQDNSLAKCLDGHEDGVYSVVFCPDGSLVSGSLDTTVKLWEFSEGPTMKSQGSERWRCIRTLNGHTVSSDLSTKLKKVSRQTF